MTFFAAQFLHTVPGQLPELYAAVAAVPRSLLHRPLRLLVLRAAAARRAVPAPPERRGLARITTRQAVQATAGGAFALGRRAGPLRAALVLGRRRHLVDLRQHHLARRDPRTRLPPGPGHGDRHRRRLLRRRPAARRRGAHRRPRRRLRLRDLLHGGGLVQLDDVLRDRHGRRCSTGSSASWTPPCSRCGSRRPAVGALGAALAVVLVLPVTTHAITDAWIQRALRCVHACTAEAAARLAGSPTPTPAPRVAELEVLLGRVRLSLAPLVHPLSPLTRPQGAGPAGARPARRLRPGGARPGRRRRRPGRLARRPARRRLLAGWRRRWRRCCARRAGRGAASRAARASQSGAAADTRALAHLHGLERALAELAAPLHSPPRSPLVRLSRGSAWGPVVRGLGPDRRWCACYRRRRKIARRTVASSRGGRQRRRAARAGRAFIGSFTSAGGRGVTAAAVDRDTGALTVLGSHGRRPRPLVSSRSAPDGDALYAVSETAERRGGRLRRQRRRARPLAGPSRPVDGDGPTHLALAARPPAHRQLRLRQRHRRSPCAPTASLGGAASGAPARGQRPATPSASRARTPTRCCPTRAAAGCSASTSAPTRYGSCALDPATASCACTARPRCGPGTGPRHLAFHPRGRARLRPERTRPTVTVCRWDAADGRPGAAGGDAGAARATRRRRPTRYPSEVVVSPDGRFLWTANRGHDSISVLALDEPARRPRLVTTVPLRRPLAARPGPRPDRPVRCTRPTSAPGTSPGSPSTRRRASRGTAGSVEAPGGVLRGLRLTRTAARPAGTARGTEPASASRSGPSGPGRGFVRPCRSVTPGQRAGRPAAAAGAMPSAVVYLRQHQLADRRVGAERLGGRAARLLGGGVQQARVDLRADQVRRQRQLLRAGAAQLLGDRRRPSPPRRARRPSPARRAARPAACR